MMTEEKPKFGPPRKEDIFQKYRGGYYIIRPVGANEQYIGKVKEIDSARGKICLNPYFGLYFNRKNGKNLYNLIDKDYDLFLEFSKVSFEPTTEEAILFNCYLSNKARIEEAKKAGKKREKTGRKKAD